MCTEGDADNDGVVDDDTAPSLGILRNLSLFLRVLLLLLLLKLLRLRFRSSGAASLSSLLFPAFFSPSISATSVVGFASSGPPPVRGALGPCDSGCNSGSFALVAASSRHFQDLVGVVGRCDLEEASSTA